MVNRNELKSEAIALPYSGVNLLCLIIIDNKSISPDPITYKFNLLLNKSITGFNGREGKIECNNENREIYSSYDIIIDIGTSYIFNYSSFNYSYSF